MEPIFIIALCEFLEGSFLVRTKKKSKFDNLFTPENVTITYKPVSEKETQKIIVEIARLLYDYFRQRQKSQSYLSKSLGEPQQEVA